MFQDMKRVIREQETKEIVSAILGVGAIILMVFAFTFLMIGLSGSSVVPV